MVCADFQGYLEREAEAATVYRDAREWSRRALFNRGVESLLERRDHPPVRQ